MAPYDQFLVERFKCNEVDLVADRTRVEPQFLLLHAGGEKRDVWHPVMHRLLQHGYGSMALDQRGHGESTGSAADGIASFARDAGEIISGFKKPFVAVGASLGGFAIMLAQSTQTARHALKGIVLVDVIPDPDPARVKAFLRTTTPPLDQSPLVDDILGCAQDLRDACAQIAVPVLLTTAGSGAIVRSDIDRLRERVRALEVVCIEKASHLIARDEPDALADALIAFGQSLEIAAQNKEIKH